MIILNEVVKLSNLNSIDGGIYFPDMIKGVVDIDLKRIAFNAPMHADLESLMLTSLNSKQTSLYGFNIYFEDGQIDDIESVVEFDSMINIPRNRENGFPRVGTEIKDRATQQKILEVINKWVKI